MPLRILDIHIDQKSEQTEPCQDSSEHSESDWTPKIDLRGQLFGSLRAIRPGPRVDGKPAWICHCEACGTEKTVKTRDLRRGAAISCGCQWKKRGLEQMQYVDGTCIEMLKSNKIRKNNSTGYTGVSYDAKNKKYRAEITLQGKRYYLGRYASLEQAVNVRNQAKKQLHQAFIEEHQAQSE